MKLPPEFQFLEVQHAVSKGVELLRGAPSGTQVEIPLPDGIGLHIGRKAPKGYKELGSSVYLGKGIWLMRCEKVTGVDTV